VGETKKRWFGRAGSPEPTSDAPVETGNGSAQSSWSTSTSGWLNRVKESVVLATTAKKSDEPSASKEVELKTMEGARAPTTGDAGGDPDSGQQQETFTIKFSIVDDEHQEEDGKGKEVEKQQHENDEETRKQQNDGSSNSVPVGNGGR
jgi:hypothetical protein